MPKESRCTHKIAVVGTGDVGVSRDRPDLDMAYKLTAYAGLGRLKTSTGKRSLPGRKQVFRQEENGRIVGDVIARHDEEQAGRPLLVKVMEGGERLPAGREEAHAARERAARELTRLPRELLGPEPPGTPYPVRISQALLDYYEATRRRVTELQPR